MGLLSKRSGKMRGSGRRGSIEIYVKCDRCEEIIKTHIFKVNELYPTYSEEGPAYTLRKELIGSKCPNRVQLYMEFNGAKQIIRKDITGGTIQDIREL